MTKFSLLFFLVPALLPAQPNIEWAKAFGGSNADQGRAISQSSDGGYFVASTTSSNNGDVFGNHGGVDFWVLRLDSVGTILWKKPFGGSTDEQPYALQATSDKGCIAVGYTLSNDEDVSGNHGYYDAWVLKLDSLGAIQWQRCLGGSDWEQANDVQQTKDGGYIVVGRSRSTDGDVTVNHGYLDYWIVKLDGSGTLEWQKSYGGSSEDDAYAVMQTLDGGYIVGGESSSLDGNVTGNHGESDCWILKLDPEGKIEWEKSLGGASIDRANDVIESRDGGFVVLGQVYSINGDVTGNHGYNDFWVVKLNNNGDIEWQKALGGSNEEYARSIWQTRDGGYVMTGQTQSNNGDALGNDGGADVWVVKITETGEIQWQKTLGGTQDELGNSIQQTRDEGYILAGHARSSNGDVSGVHGQVDLWVVKLAPIFSLTVEAPSGSLQIYPNPAHKSIFLNFPAEAPTLSICITDLLGRVVSRQRISEPGFSGWEVDIAALREGFYWISAVTDAGRVYGGRFWKD